MGTPFQLLNFPKYSLLKSICLRTLQSADFLFPLPFQNCPFQIAHLLLNKLKAYSLPVLSLAVVHCFGLWKSPGCKTKRDCLRMHGSWGRAKQKSFYKKWVLYFISLWTSGKVLSSIISLRTLKQYVDTGLCNDTLLWSKKLESFFFLTENRSYFCWLVWQWGLTLPGRLHCGHFPKIFHKFHVLLEYSLKHMCNVKYIGNYIIYNH